MNNIVPGTTLGNYTILKLTGRGAFSSVYQAVHNLTGIKVALKVVLASSLSETMQKAMVENEINVFKLIDHPLLVEYYESFFDKEYFVVALEFVEGGSILSYINKFGKLSEDVARHYFCQLLQALEYLQCKCRIAHRDLKAENVLIDENHNIRLIDFGFSHVMTNKIPVINGPCGSPAYAPPEVLKNQPFTPLSDMWSAGVFLYGITTGTLPFVDDNIQRLMQKIVYTEPKFGPNVSPQLKDLILKLLKKNSSQRITIHEIWSHPWIAMYRGIGELPKLSNITRLPVRSDIVTKMSMQINPQDLEIYVKEHKDTQEVVEYKLLCRQDNIGIIKSYSRWLGAENMKFNDNGDIPESEQPKAATPIAKSEKIVTIQNPQKQEQQQPKPAAQTPQRTNQRPIKIIDPKEQDMRASINISKQQNPVARSSISLSSAKPIENNQRRASCIDASRSSNATNTKKEPVQIQEPENQRPPLNIENQNVTPVEAPKSSRELTRQDQLRMLLEKKEKKVGRSKTQTNLRLMKL